LTTLFSNNQADFSAFDLNFFDVTPISIISQLGWGLGYAGMPHIIHKFMAIKNPNDIKKAAWLGSSWTAFTMISAIGLGVIGLAYLPNLDNPETVFISMIEGTLLPEGSMVLLALLGGIFLSAIIAAIMSTADSQLLVASSSVIEDVYRKLSKTEVSEKRLVWLSRWVVVVVVILGGVIASLRIENVMNLVSNAWALFGGAFSALIISSLYRKHMTKLNAILGLLSGALCVVVWDYLPLVGGTLNDLTGLYSLVPAFILSGIFCCIPLHSPKE
jgi:sodium/proline symporter